MFVQRPSCPLSRHHLVKSRISYNHRFKPFNCFPRCILIALWFLWCRDSDFCYQNLNSRPHLFCHCFVSSLCYASPCCYLVCKLGCASLAPRSDSCTPFQWELTSVYTIHTQYTYMFYALDDIMVCFNMYLCKSICTFRLYASKATLVCLVPVFPVFLPMPACVNNTSM